MSYRYRYTDVDWARAERDAVQFARLTPPADRYSGQHYSDLANAVFCQLAGWPVTRDSREEIDDLQTTEQGRGTLGEQLQAMHHRAAELALTHIGHFDSVLSITGATERTYVIPKGKQGYLNVHGHWIRFDNGMTGAAVKKAVDKVLKFIGGHHHRFIESIEYTGRLYRDEPEWIVDFGS